MLISVTPYHSQDQWSRLTGHSAASSWSLSHRKGTAP